MTYLLFHIVFIISSILEGYRDYHVVEWYKSSLLKHNKLWKKFAVAVVASLILGLVSVFAIVEFNWVLLVYVPFVAASVRWLVLDLTINTKSNWGTFYIGTTGDIDIYIGKHQYYLKPLFIIISIVLAFFL